MYNLNAEDYHAYFVGNEELLVHNNCLADAMAAGREAIEEAKAKGIIDSDELSEIGHKLKAAGGGEICYPKN